MKTCPHCKNNIGRPFICDICGLVVEKAHRKQRCWDCSLIVLEERKKHYKRLTAMAIESAKQIIEERQKALRTTNGLQVPVVTQPSTQIAE